VFHHLPVPFMNFTTKSTSKLRLLSIHKNLDVIKI